MNLFAIGFSEKTNHPVLYNILNHFKVKNCYVFYIKPDEKIRPPHFTKIYFYNLLKFQLKGFSLPRKTLDKPLDKKILEDLLYCESIVLKLMERLVFIYPELSNYDDRKMFYLKHVKYWNNMLDEKKIDIAIFGIIPHTVPTFIIYHLCKLKNIPTLTLFQTHINDTAMFFDDFEDSNVRLKNTYNQLRIDLKDTPESEIQLTGRFKSHFEKQTSKLLDATPFYMKNIPKKRNIILNPLKKYFWGKRMSIINQIHTLLPPILTFHIKLKNIIKLKDITINTLERIKNLKIKNYIRLMQNYKLSKYYKSLTTIPDYTKKYIYVPFHKQPEVSTSPMAGLFAHQQLMVELLSYLLPKNVYLYVKENPAQKSECRSKEFYDQLFLDPKVRLIDISTDTYKLISYSIAVATCSGTAGWEALFREKPVLMFGINYYQYANGVFRIKTIDDCRKALDQIIKQNFRPSLKDIKIFLKSIELSTFKACIHPEYKGMSTISHKQNVKNLSQVFIEKISLILEKNG